MRRVAFCRKPRKPRKRIEANKQMRLVDKMIQHGVPHYSIPNEGKRTPATAIYLKRMGMKPGMPDLHIFRPSQGYHGLYIEMKKSASEKPKPHQLACHEALQKEGYLVQVHWDEKEAWRAILLYLEEPYIPWDLWE